MTRSLCLAVGAAPLICTFPRENSTATKWCVSTSRLASGPGWQRCQTNPIRTAMECPKADDLTRHSTSKAASLSLEDSIPGVLNELLKDDLSYCELWFLFQFQNWPAQERPLGVQSWQQHMGSTKPFRKGAKPEEETSFLPCGKQSSVIYYLIQQL